MSTEAVRQSTELTPETDTMLDLVQRAKRAARSAGLATTAAKNTALIEAGRLIDQQRQQLLDTNQQEMKNARQAELSPELIERLELNSSRVDDMIDGLNQLAQLADPVGAMGAALRQTSGIQVAKMRVPLGVIGVIYESRPGVTADAAGLCLKAGNAVILRGGSEALSSSRLIAQCMREGLDRAGLARDIVQLVPSSDRALVDELLSYDQYINVIIPRGGRSLIEKVRAVSKIPIIKHLDGICHVYVDQSADLAMAERIAINSKTQRYGVCNAMETLLLHRELPAEWIASLAQQYLQKGVELRVCPTTMQILQSIERSDDQRLVLAKEQDWRTEYLAAILSIRLVDDLEMAIDHIGLYGSGHTDCIVTEWIDRAERFVNAVDSSSVMVNTSTRFADGYQYGLGAEIGISTDRLHVRGPVGLEGLTIEKYVVNSRGAIRD